MGGAVTLLIILSVIVTAIISSYLWKMRREIYLMSRLPGPSLLSLMMTVIKLAFEDHNGYFVTFSNLFEEYGSILSGWYGAIPLVLMIDPQHIEKVVKHDQLCTRLPNCVRNNVMVPYYKTGVLAIEGELWRQHRKILNGTFHVNVLQTFVECFTRNSNILAERLLELADGSFHRLDIHFTQCTFDVIMDTSFGFNLELQKSNDIIIITKFVEIVEMQMERALTPWLFFDCIFKRTELYSKQKLNISSLNDIVRQCLLKRMELYKTIEANGENVHDFLKENGRLGDALLRRPEFGEDDMIGEITCVAGAGAETSSSVCCYALAILCDHQDIQRKVVEEQRSVFGNDFLRPVTNEDLTSMPYLEQVLKETLRLFPPVPLHCRTTVEEVDIGNGHIIPKGTFVLMMPYVTHRNPDYFPDPDRFDPERFSPDNCIGRHPYAYIPFGLGRRMCVGYNFAMMEMKTILSTVIRRYHFLEVKGGVAGIISSLQLGIVMKPKSDFYFKFSPRSNIMVSNNSVGNSILQQ